MSIFHWLRGSDDEPQLSPELRKRLDELEEQNRKTERQLSRLELDWSEWFNKFRLLYARLTKRVKDEEEKAAEDAPRSTNGDRASLPYPENYPRMNRQRKNY